MKKENILRAYAMFENVDVYQIKTKNGPKLCLDLLGVENVLVESLHARNPLLQNASELSELPVKDYTAYSSDIILKDFMKSLKIAMMIKGIINMPLEIAQILGLSKEESVPTKKEKQDIKPVAVENQQETPQNQESIEENDVVESNFGDFDDDEEITITN